MSDTSTGFHRWLKDITGVDIVEPYTWEHYGAVIEGLQKEGLFTFFDKYCGILIPCILTSKDLFFTTLEKWWVESGGNYTVNTTTNTYINTSINTSIKTPGVL